MTENAVFGKVFRRDRPIELQEWGDAIVILEFLEPMPDRVTKNPFTNKETIFSGLGKAVYKSGLAPEGSASLENGEVLTTGIPVKECSDMASFLNAIYLADDRS